MPNHSILLYAIVTVAALALFLSTSASRRRMREGIDGGKGDPANADERRYKEHLHYYHLLREREKAREYNMTAKQAYVDLNDSMTVNLIHVGIMFFLVLSVLFTLFNLDYFRKFFTETNELGANVYRSVAKKADPAKPKVKNAKKTSLKNAKKMGAKIKGAPAPAKGPVQAQAPAQAQVQAQVPESKAPAQKPPNNRRNNTGRRRGRRRGNAE